VILVYDGGCPFCRVFALRAELAGGIEGLQIHDGRADHGLRAELKGRGFDLARGAVLIDGPRTLHGAEAIAWICSRMNPSDPLLGLLGQLFAAPRRAQRFYPLLLWARRTALQWKGLPEDPDQAGLRQA
jgi:predicted DCC family thiol-disulfide oxidoreductase YuxK